MGVKVVAGINSVLVVVCEPKVILFCSLKMGHGKLAIEISIVEHGTEEHILWNGLPLG